MPDVFRDADDAVNSSTTRFVTMSGPETPFPLSLPRGRNSTLRDFRDSSPNTILVLEAGPEHSVLWTKPEDLPFDAAAPMESLGTIPPATGLLAGMADGRVLTLTPTSRPTSSKPWSRPTATK